MSLSKTLLALSGDKRLGEMSLSMTLLALSGDKRLGEMSLSKTLLALSGDKRLREMSLSKTLLALSGAAKIIKISFQYISDFVLQLICMATFSLLHGIGTISNYLVARSNLFCFILTMAAHKPII